MIKLWAVLQLFSLVISQLVEQLLLEKLKLVQNEGRKVMKGRDFCGWY